LSWPRLPDHCQDKGQKTLAGRPTLAGSKEIFGGKQGNLFRPLRILALQGTSRTAQQRAGEHGCSGQPVQGRAAVGAQGESQGGYRWERRRGDTVRGTARVGVQRTECLWPPGDGAGRRRPERRGADPDGAEREAPAPKCVGLVVRQPRQASWGERLGQKPQEGGANSCTFDSQAQQARSADRRPCRSGRPRQQPPVNGVSGPARCGLWATCAALRADLTRLLTRSQLSTWLRTSGVSSTTSARRRG
jgi:hypothetical protein